MSELTVEEQIVAMVAGQELPEPPPAEEPDNGAEPEEPEQGPAEEAGEPEPEPEEEPLLAGRFRTAEELERGYEELNKKLGEQGQELGEARRLAEEVAAQRQILEQMQQPAQPAYDPGSVDDWLVQNPQQIPQAAQQALDTGDNYLYQRALAAWAELDQFGALDFHARQIAAAQAEQVRQEMQPALQGLQRVETTSQMQQAWEQAAAKHDDFAAVLSSITQETLDGFPPQVLSVLQSGDQASKQQVLETLYRWQKAETTGNLPAAAAQAVAEQQEASRQARAEAQVASTAASPERTEPEPRSVFIEAFENSDAFKKAAGLI